MTSTLNRALAYLEKLPRAVTGSGGHAATWQAALACRRIGLSAADTWTALQWWNENRCDPPWSEAELRHKLASADKVDVHKPLAPRGPARPSKHRGFQPPAWPSERRSAPPVRAAVRTRPEAGPAISTDIPDAITDEIPGVIESGAWHLGAPPSEVLTWCAWHRGETPHWANRAGELVCGACHPPPADVLAKPQARRRFSDQLVRRAHATRA